MKFVELFAGIGGLGRGLERAGHECVFQAEIDPYCQRVLAKHWPDVRRIADVKEVTADDCKEADAIVGGFPCQPVSDVGSRRGVLDDRWLWPEFFRLIRSVRPSYVIVENVPGLRKRGGLSVLGDLASIGYDAEWTTVTARAVGAPHQRARVFIVAYPNSSRRGGRGLLDQGDVVPNDLHYHWDAAPGGIRWSEWERWLSETLADGYWGDASPGVLGVDDGITRWVDADRRRIKALGNAVVPQVAEWIGRALPFAR